MKKMNERLKYKPQLYNNINMFVLENYQKQLVTMKQTCKTNEHLQLGRVSKTY